MPRNGSGTYTLPQAAFVAGTTISSSAVNSDFTDIATALTGSLPRDGQAGMTGQLKTADGTVGVPAHSFSSEATTGLYRPSSGRIGVAIAGVSIGYFDSTGWVGSVPSASIPFGMIADFSGASAPSRWLLCAGQAVSRTTYALLFAVTSTTYGAGNGSTTFNVPDLRGRVTAGKDDMNGSAASRLTTTYYGGTPTALGSAGGAQSSTLITANLPAYTPSGSIGITDPGHNHTLTEAGAIIPVNPIAGANVVQPGGNLTSTDTTGISATFTGSAQGGTQTAFANVQPSLIVNKIIYAGV